MAVMKMKEAAAFLGWKSPSTLYRYRKAGRLDAFLRQGGSMIETDGLSHHLANLLGADSRRPDSVTSRDRERGGHTTPDVDGETLNDAKRRRESALASIAELELAEKERSLVKLEDVERKLFAQCRAARDAVMAVEQRIVDTVAAVAGGMDFEQRQKVAEAIRSELKAACQRIAEINAGE